MLNKAILIGNLVRDPEMKTTTSGLQVCNYSIATSSTWKDPKGVKQVKPEYHSIVTYGKLAEIAATYTHKGSKVYIEGRIETRSWEGQDGIKKYKTEIVASNMIMLDPKGSGAINAPIKAQPLPLLTAEPVEDGEFINSIPF